MRGAFSIAVLILGLCARAQAQHEAPQACGQQGPTADYGDVEVGSVVVLQRHRFEAGDPNWDPAMERFLGRVARVARLSGVDERGCPGVRVEVDGGRYFWRLRDLNVGAGIPGPPPRRRIRSGIPQQCGGASIGAFGPIRAGTRVVLGRHRPVMGDANWSAEMTAFVGRTAQVVRLAGTDEMGCPGVNVDADGSEWFWRIRDLRIAGDADAPIAYRTGLESDHGRPPAPESAATASDPRIPDGCGMTDQNVTYGPIQVGTEVILGRHREYAGESNWVEEMEPFVGRTARVIQLVGVDEQGCGLVHVNLDEGDFFWRVRDMRLTAPPLTP